MLVRSPRYPVFRQTTVVANADFTIRVIKAFFGNSPSMFNADSDGLPSATVPLSSSGARGLHQLWPVWQMLNIDLTYHNL